MTKSVRRAVYFSLAQRYIAFALQLGASVILARLLSPEETGIYALAAAAVAVAHLLREVGVGEYIITQQGLTREQLRSAYGLTIVGASCMAALLWATAAPLARAYSQPGLLAVMHLLAVNFLLLPLGSVSFAMLSKDLAFDRIFIVHTAAAFTGVGVTVYAAYRQYSYLSPAIGSVASIGVTIVLLAILAPKHFFLLPSLRGMRSVLRFGGVLTASRVIEQAASRGSEFIVSALLGFHATGLMSKGSSLIGAFHEFFGSAISRVATPALSRAATDPEAMRAAYREGIVLMALPHLLFFSLLALFGAEIVETLFGRNWMGAVHYLQIGAVGSFLWAPYMLYASLLAVGRSASWQLRIQLVGAPALLLAVSVGSLFNLEAVAAGLVMAGAVKLFVISRFLKTACGITSASLFVALRPSVLLCIPAVVAAVAVKLLGYELGLAPWLRLAAGALTAVAVLIPLAARANHPVMAEIRRLWPST